MGIYIYTLKAATRNLVLDSMLISNTRGDTGTVTVNLCSFAHKCFTTHSNRLEAQREQQINHGCDQYTKAHYPGSRPTGWGSQTRTVHGITPVEVWAVLYGFEEGSPVYRNVTDGVWSAGDCFPGEYVGTLTKKGGRWHVVPDRGELGEGHYRRQQ